MKYLLIMALGLSIIGCDGDSDDAAEEEAFSLSDIAGVWEVVTFTIDGDDENSDYFINIEASGDTASASFYELDGTDPDCYEFDNIRLDIIDLEDGDFSITVNASSIEPTATDLSLEISEETVTFKFNTDELPNTVVELTETDVTVEEIDTVCITDR